MPPPGYARAQTEATRRRLERHRQNHDATQAALKQPDGHGDYLYDGGPVLRDELREIVQRLGNAHGRPPLPLHIDELTAHLARMGAV